VIWSDTVHVPEIQVSHPQITSEYDIDESLAAGKPPPPLPLVATERLLVAGTHLHVPDFAHLLLNGDAYRLVPEACSVVV
jgi:hypothetical protein